MLKKNLFVRYLEKIGLSKSAVRQYSDYYLEEESLKKLAKNLYNVGSIYEITSCAVISALYEKAKSLPVNKKWNNGLTAALKKYGDFIKTNSSSDFFEGCSTKWGVQVIQKILFGAPGTGKSYKIDYNLFKDKNGNLIGKGIKEIPENRKFRTTFHPDYDYAQFVGAYKPQKVQCNDNGLLSEEQLAHKLSESFLKRDNSEFDKTSAIVLFGLQYANSLNGKTISQIVKLSGIGDEAYKKANLSAAVKAQLQFSNVDGKITYSFVPQVFAKAYAAAWKQYFDAGSVSTVENQVYLVIEEINRGNCAQIFGDIFQLLDRVSDGTDKGFSQYSIDADCDFADWLKNNDAGLKSVWNQYKDKVDEGKLRLPPNLNILATMNTSDQSLFPMDSAFKRRFDWEYVPISFEGKDAANYQIDIDGSQYSWQKFVETINEKILAITASEDKQLGEFFIKPDNGNIISKERFLGKVMFYLWNEVCKDEHKNGSFFRAKINDNKDFFTFQDLYKKKDLLKLFMDELLKKE